MAIVRDPQSWLTERVSGLFPNLKKEELKLGICFGTAHMGMQAFLAEDLKGFEARLQEIKSIPEDQFSKEIELLQQKRLNIIKLVHGDIGDKKYLLPHERIEIINTIEIKEKFAALAAIAKEERFTQEEWEKEVARRKESILFNAFIQKKILEKNEQLSHSINEDERKMALTQSEFIRLDIPIYFAGVLLYQNTNEYPLLFPEEAKPRSQSGPLTLPLVISKKLEKEGGVSKIKDFSGAYSKNELIDFFTEFEQSFAAAKPPLTKPISFILRSGDHAITVGYDPQQKNWVFIDANQLKIPTPRFDAATLSGKVLNAFSSNGVAIFGTDIYAHSSLANTVRDCFSHWENKAKIKEMHKVTFEKAALVDSRNSSWLFVAAKMEQTQIVSDLLEKNANPNLAGNSGATPLFVAAQRGYKKIVDLLLTNNADPSVLTKTGSNALYTAVYSGYKEIVEEILKKDVDPDVAPDGWTSLLVAIDHHDKEIVTMLLNKKANPNLATKEGATPLFIAVKNGDKELIDMLLEHGAYPDRVSMGMTPLCTAVLTGQSTIVAKLLEKGADPHFAIDGVPLLFFAIDKGYTEIVLQLLKKGANPNSRTKGDTVPLFIAVLKDHAEIVHHLLKSGAQPEVVGKDGRTFVHVAAENGNKKIVMSLLEKKIDLNTQMKNGATPIFVAAQNGHKDVVTLLLKENADTSLVFKSTIEKLKDAAIKLNVEKSMNEFIQKYKSENSLHSDLAEICMRPKDIAEVMGHTEIVNELVLHESKRKRKLSDISDPQTTTFSNPKKLIP